MVVIINGFYQSDFMNKLLVPDLKFLILCLGQLAWACFSGNSRGLLFGSEKAVVKLQSACFKHKKNQDYCEVRQLRISVVCADQIETSTSFFFPCSLQTQTRSKATDALKNRYNLKSLTFKNTTQVQRRHFVCQRIAHNGSLGGAFDRQI